MEIKELFEAIDSEIITDKMKTTLQESFDKAVASKVQKLITEKLEAEKDTLVEAYDERLNEYRAEMLDRMSEYLNLVAEEYIENNAIKIEESLRIETLDALMEGFDSMLVTGGFELKNITTGVNESNDEEIRELEKKVNSLAKSNISLKSRNSELLKIGVMAEITEGMSMVQKEKFLKLSEVIEFNSDDLGGYVNKLDTLRESVLGASKPEVKSLEESTKPSQDKSWKRFV